MSPEMFLATEPFVAAAVIAHIDTAFRNGGRDSVRHVISERETLRRGVNESTQVRYAQSRWIQRWRVSFR